MLEPVTLHVHGEPVVLTVETLAKTFQWFADNQRACAEGAQNGDFFVNDVENYVLDCNARAQVYEAQIEKGPFGRLSLAFLQRAYYIQSGESVPMLSK